jgi:hypothetical protein
MASPQHTDTIAPFEMANAKRLAMSCLLIAVSELNSLEVDLDKAHEWAEKAVDRIGNLRISHACPGVGGAA